MRQFPETVMLQNPPHPGELVKHECLKELNLSVTKAADILGVTRQALYNSRYWRESGGLRPELLHHL